MADKAVGCTRGRLNTQIHAAVDDGLGNPVEFLLSAGNDHLRAGEGGAGVGA